MFKEERDTSSFEWTMLGKIDEGRPNLGFMTDVSIYRLMQFTLRDVLIKDFGVEKADHIFYRAGETAGRHFYARRRNPKQATQAAIATIRLISLPEGHQVDQA